MTRVLIATNEPILAKGLETVLAAGGLEIAAVCHDVFELFECFQSCRPDIAVLDMPVLPAPEVIRDLHRLAPHCQLVAVAATGFVRLASPFGGGHSNDGELLRTRSVSLHAGESRPAARPSGSSSPWWAAV